MKIRPRVLSLLVLPFLCACGAFRERIRTERVVEAPAAVVWDVLVDVARYPEWNPYHVAVVRDDHARGPLAVHEPLQVRIHKPSGKRLSLPVHVKAVRPRAELTWGGGVPGLFTGEHRFLLEPLGDERTLLRQDEDFDGAALPLVPLGVDGIRAGYGRTNEAVGRRAEAIWRGRARAPVVGAAR